MKMKWVWPFMVISVAAALMLFFSFHLNDSRGVRIAAAGDILLDRGVRPYLEQRGYAYPYDGVKRQIGDADIAVANLECPLTGSRSAVLKPREIIFKGDEENARVLRDTGFDVLNLANNHTMDYEREGLLDTLRLLSHFDIHYTGAGINRSEARKAVYLKKKGIRIGFLGYSDFPPEGYIHDESKADVARVDERSLKSEIETAKKQCDILIVQFHWGKEFDHFPSERQKLLAHAAIDSGGDLVMGHHPHVLQGIEKYNGKLIFYSLGNFVFDRQVPEGTDESLLVELSMGAGYWESVRCIPLRIKECKPEIAQGEDAEKILADLGRYSKDFGTAIQVVDGMGYIFPD